MWKIHTLNPTNRHQARSPEILKNLGPSKPPVGTCPRWNTGMQHLPEPFGREPWEQEHNVSFSTFSMFQVTRLRTKLERFLSQARSKNTYLPNTYTHNTCASFAPYGIVEECRSEIIRGLTSHSDIGKYLTPNTPQILVEPLTCPVS